MHESRRSARGEETGVSGMMKKLKRRLSWTIKGARPLDGSLSELAEHLTIDDTSNSNDTFFGRPMSVPLQHNGESDFLLLLGKGPAADCSVSLCLCLSVCLSVCLSLSLSLSRRV